jgi:exodeoxyribonuclease VII small subunit
MSAEAGATAQDEGAAAVPYRERLARLERIVDLLQRGDDLDEVVALYAEARALHASCEASLAAAEKAVEGEEKRD